MSRDVDVSEIQRAISDIRAWSNGSGSRCLFIETNSNMTDEEVLALAIITKCDMWHLGEKCTANECLMARAVIRLSAAREEALEEAAKVCADDLDFWCKSALPDDVLNRATGRIRALKSPAAPAAGKLREGE